MDEQRFDQLSRRFAAFRTRRQAVKAIAGAVVATVAGVKGAAAQTCTPQYSPCGGDADCCPGAVCEFGMCTPGCRVNGTFISAWISPPENICGQCQPGVSTTSLVPVNEGMSCWSGNLNAGVTTCQNGACVGEAPQSCPPPTACHLEGEVDPATGLCVNPPAPAGTPCGIDSMCYGGFYQPADTCDGAGFCIGGGSQVVSCAPYQCGDGACLTSCSSAADCVLGLECLGGRCGICEANALGTAECSSDGDCPSGQLCQNGGCFSPCSTGCSDECTNCVCVGSTSNGTACRDANFFVGACNTNEECPTGSVCSSFSSGRSDLRRLCTRPCPSVEQ